MEFPEGNSRASRQAAQVLADGSFNAFRTVRGLEDGMFKAGAHCASRGEST